MREFFRGMRLLVRGFAFWSRRPGLMALGLLPAAIVAGLLLAGLVTLGTFLPDIADSLTPFADAWPVMWATVVRLAVGTAVLGAALVVAAVSFTALTLVVGEPFYDRIWKAAETATGHGRAEADYGFWRSVRDALALLARGAVIAALAALLGLVPLVGGALGAVVGVLLTGWLLAEELTARALAARGIGAAERRRLLRRSRGRSLGFGVATQLCFLVPLGAVAVMPAAVVGSTMLAHSLLGERPAQPVGVSAPGGAEPGAD